MVFLFWINHKSIGMAAACFQIQYITLSQGGHDLTDESGINHPADTVRQGFFFIYRAIIKICKVGNKITDLNEIGFGRILFHDILNKSSDRLVCITPEMGLDRIIGTDGAGSFAHGGQPSFIRDGQIVPLAVAVVFNPLDIIGKGFFQNTVVFVPDPCFVDDNIDDLQIQ